MKNLSGVVWAEGMHLSQHHFQAQSRYFENLTEFVAATLAFRPYGVSGCEMDAEALLNGTASVVHARGVMPDGLTFYFPLDAPPDPVEIAERFSPTRESHVVLLGIAPHRPDGPNVAGENGDARFVPMSVPVPDETTGRDEKPVAFARKRFRLLLDDEDAGDLVTLPLARIRRDGAGRFVYDAEWVPPALHVGASERLVTMLGRLIDLLESRDEALSSERRGSASAADYAPREIAGYWLSHAIRSALPRLRHIHGVRTAHPERLYAEMSRLAGALCTFAIGSHPRTLPAYDHDDLGACFGALERHIRDHLEIVLPTRALTVALGPTEESLYVGVVTDPRAFTRARWYLGVESTAGAAAVIAGVPRLAKVCSAKHILRLVREAYPGMVLEHVPHPPAELSPRAGAQYFTIRPDQGCWPSIAQTREVAVYLPAAIPVTRLELKVVTEAAASES